NISDDGRSFGNSNSSQPSKDLLLKQFIKQNVLNISRLPRFKYIYQNDYPNQDIRNKLEIKDLKNLHCGCLPESKENSKLIQCDSDCINRLLNIECSLECNCGSKCDNRPISNSYFEKLIPEKTSDKGWGLFAINDINKNQFISKVTGEIVDFTLIDDNEKFISENEYLFGLHNNIAIDLKSASNICRFLNHSCAPNCELKK
ncbi:MAG: Histone-lysine N-methyltransferase setd2, partial [Paramarteilia canceri]